jgi:hypothetical protein
MQLVVVRAGGKVHLPFGSLFGYRVSTMSATTDIGKKKGRPIVGSKGIMVKLPPDDLELLDLWIAANAPEASRPEALRRILRLVALRHPKR